MSYLDQSRRSSPGSMAAVAAIHAVVGLALVTGLTVSGAIKDRDILETWEFKDPPPPEVEPTIEPPKSDAQTEITPPVHVPVPTLDLVKQPPVQPTTDEILPPLPPIPQPTLAPRLPDPGPAPGFDPVKARPKNRPGSWLSDDDYRPGWIRQEMAGVATFRLDIAANGRVSGCAVTGSTGHAPLDAATCELVTKRARFEPARGRDGEATAGSYVGSVEWRLPE